MDCVHRFHFFKVSIDTKRGSPLITLSIISLTESQSNTTAGIPQSQMPPVLSPLIVPLPGVLNACTVSATETVAVTCLP